MARKAKKVVSHDNPKLITKPYGDGREAYYLEYHFGSVKTPRLDADGEPMYYVSGKSKGKPMFVVKHNRRQERIDELFRYSKPADTEQETHNKNADTEARAIRAKREQEVLGGTYKSFSLNGNIIEKMRQYESDVTKHDERGVRMCINRFCDFLVECHSNMIMSKTPRRDKNGKEVKTRDGKDVFDYTFSLTAKDMTKDLMIEWAIWLGKHSTDGGAPSCWKRWIKLLNYSIEKGWLKSNPTKGMKPSEKPSGVNKEKTALTAQQVTDLYNCHYRGESPEIQRAFMWCIFSGMRWCDVKDLRYSNINHTDMTFSFIQKKVEHTAKETSRVTNPINDFMLKLIGKPEDYGKTTDSLIFDLPSQSMCIRSLKVWCRHAGITEPISWHCSRVTFASLLLDSNVSPEYIAKMLGHAGLELVTRYAKTRDEKKREALEKSMPNLDM